MRRGRAYRAAARFYVDGPASEIRFYFAAAGAAYFPGPTVFWPYSQALEIENADETGELTGPSRRTWDRGENRNNLPGDHASGSAADFAGLSVVPWAPIAPTPGAWLPACDYPPERPPVGHGGSAIDGSAEVLSGPFALAGGGGSMIDGSAEVISLNAIGEGGSLIDGSAIVEAEFSPVGDGGSLIDGSLADMGRGLPVGDGGSVIDGSVTELGLGLPVGDGGSVIDGSADLAAELARIGSGGSAIDGSAGISFGVYGDGGSAIDGGAFNIGRGVPVGSGGSAIDGGVINIGRGVPVGSGGSAIDGRAAVSSSVTPAGDGGSTIDGSAAHLTNSVPVGNGGSSIDGTIASVGRGVPAGNGGSVIDGSAGLAAELAKIGNGGSAIDGSALVSAQWLKVGNGGSAIDGTADVYWAGGPLIETECCPLGTPQTQHWHFSEKTGFALAFPDDVLVAWNFLNESWEWTFDQTGNLKVACLEIEAHTFEFRLSSADGNIGPLLLQPFFAPHCDPFLLVFNVQGSFGRGQGSYILTIT